jgi:hypothetical protein
MRLINLTTRFALAITSAHAGPITYGVCQAGCATLAVACYSAAGFVFSITFAAGAPPAIVSCNSAFGTCSGACATAFLVPGP